MFSLKPEYKIWRVLDQPIGTFVYFLCVVRIFNKKLLLADPCCRSLIKEFAYAFSCAYIELWMHMGSLERTQKARVGPRLRLELLLRTLPALQTFRVHP